jgi:RNA polymerase sigma factor (sigma-70 family)
VSPRPDVDRALRELVARYGKLIRSVVLRVSGRAVADRLGDDIEQTVVTALWQQLEREQTIEFPASYLYRCAVRETIRAVRREHVRETEPLSDELPGELPDPESLALGRERAEDVRRCLELLDEDRRLAVRGHLAGMSVSEIMEMNGWAYQKARNLIARGMADLRRRLEEDGHGR